MLRRLIAASYLLVVMAGCGGDHAVSNADKHPIFKTWSGTKAFLRETCPMKPEPSKAETDAVEVLASLIDAANAAVAPTMIDKSLDWFTEYLKKQKAVAATTEAKAIGELYKREGLDAGSLANPKYHCLVMVRGTFGDATPKAEKSNEVWTEDNLKQFNLVAPPDLYLELRIVYQNKGTHMALMPAFLDYRASKAKPSATGEKDLLITVVFKTMQQINGEVTEKTFATFPLAIKKTKVGSRLSGGALAGLMTDVQMLPPPVERKAGNKQITDLIAFDVLITMTETADAGTFYLKASGVLSKHQEGITPETVKLLKKLLGQGKEEGVQNKKPGS